MLGVLLTTVAVAAANQVAVDWAGMSDATVRRCGLEHVQNLMLQGLLEDGFAVVDRVGPEVIAVTLVEIDGGVKVVARRNLVAAQRRVMLPRRCESTIGIDLQAAVRATTAEVARNDVTASDTSLPDTAGAYAWTPPPVTDTTRSQISLATQVAAVNAPPAHPSGVSPWAARVGLGVRASPTTSAFALLMATFEWRLGSWSVGPSAGFAFRQSHDVTAFEPSAGGTVTRYLLERGAVALGVGVEAQVLGHVFHRDDGTHGHVDGLFALPVRLEARDLGLGVVAGPTLRLRPTTNHWNGDLAYANDRVGAFVALVVRFGT